MIEKILVIKPPHRMFPLGMAYVLACLENHGIDYDFTDANFGDDYKKLLKKNDYYAVATGGLISQYKFFGEVSDAVREIRPGTPLIMGGGITKDLQPEYLFDKLHSTYGIIGEAETSFPFLVDALKYKKTGFGTIPGLVYKDPETGKIRKNPVQRLDFATADILPAWHRFNVDYYINDWEHGFFGHRLCMPVISARGCTGKCTICSNLLGDLSKRPIDQVVREIGILSERYAFDWIQFYNEMFYSTREEIVKFCENFSAAKLKKNWTCDLRVDADFDVNTFRLLKNSGCVAVFGGLESGSNKILSRMQKETTREMITRFYRTAEAAGLPCLGTSIVGNEGETEADMRETVDMITNEKMRTIEVLLCTYPGTKIYENAVARGLIVDEWKYMERLNFTDDIWDASKSKKEYLNISDIPDSRFWEAVTGEWRRFNTFNLTRYVPKNMTYAYRFGMLIKVSGACTECGSVSSFTALRKMLGMQTYCGSCFRTMEFNLYELPEFSGHRRYLCDELRNATRLAIAGTGPEATVFLKYDYFSINYQSIAAFVEVDKKPSGISDFFHLPRIRLDGLPSLKPDTLLIVDDLFGDSEFKIRAFYLKKNIEPPKIVHLLPDDKRTFSGLVRFARQHAAPTIMNKCLSGPVILLPILVAAVNAWFLKTLKSNYTMLVKNSFVRMVLEKMRR